MEFLLCLTFTILLGATDRLSADLITVADQNSFATSGLVDDPSPDVLECRSYPPIAQYRAWISFLL